MNLVLAAMLALGAKPGPAEVYQPPIIGHMFECKASVPAAGQQIHGTLYVAEDGRFSNFQAKLERVPVDSNPKVYDDGRLAEPWSHIGKAWWDMSWSGIASGNDPMKIPGWADATLTFHIEADRTIPKAPLLKIERGSQFDLSLVAETWADKGRTSYFHFPLATLLAYGTGLDTLGWEVQRRPFAKVTELKRRAGYGRFDLGPLRATAEAYDALVKTLATTAGDAERQCTRLPVYEDNSIVI